jgi:replicative DNA helicase
VETNTAIVTPRSAAEVLSTLAQKVAVGNVDQYQPVPLGFTPLDKTIGGGLRAGELLLIGGAQGTGKTTMAVQMARNIVLGGQASVLYICFEHDEEYLLNRIIAMESALDHLPAKTGGVKLTDVRKEILGTWLAQGSESADLSANPRLRPALERINRYGQNLYLLRGSQTTSTVENMRQLVARYKELSGDRRLVVFIDYMQKVPVIPDPPTETEKVTYVVQGMKDVALAYDVPMVSIVAADKEGLKAARLRNHHLRGSSAINYEADIILILNEKYSIVSKVNIEFNPYQAQRFRDWVIMTVEKNRGGQNAVDLEYEKHFEFSCFDSNGRTVQEKLIEERLYND